MGKSLLDFYNEAHGIKKKITFADCGLDIDMNILLAPVCECGCGEYMSVVLEDMDSLCDFACEMLSMQDCGYCAIYVLHNDGKTVTVIDKTSIPESGKDDMYSVISFCDKPTNADNYDLVADWQNKMGFHCYGLLQQNEDGKSYKIVME